MITLATKIKNTPDNCLKKVQNINYFEAKIKQKMEQKQNQQNICS